MRALLQRVSQAAVDVTIDGGSTERVGQIGAGLLALVGTTHDDTMADADRLADKIANLRLMPSQDAPIDRSVLDTRAEVLVVSQFTLYADTRKGRRPSFVRAGRPEEAEPLVERVAHRLAELGVPVQTGRFRTHMCVSLVNDGPVTVMIEV